MKKIKILLPYIVVLVIVLGLSISIQSTLAAWTTPGSNPPNGNVSLPIYKDANGNVIIQLGS